MQGSLDLTEKPAHVPADCVVDFDMYAPEGMGDDVHAAWKRLQGGPRFIWTPRNGGHWIATRGEDIARMMEEWEIFSYQAITIPQNPSPALPLETDPPRHGPLRAIISPLFAPATLKGAEAQARALAQRLIADLVPKGACEFMNDVARQVPIAVFLNLVDMPFDDREMLLSLAEVRVHSADPNAREQAKRTLLAYMKGVIDARRKNRGDDFISAVVHGKVDGKSLPDEDLQNMLSTVMFGGLHTIASASGFFMRFLATHPEHRAQLVADPSRIPTAVNELLRRHGVSNTSRLIAQDVTYHGVEFRKGERMTLPGSLVGLDDTLFPDALSVDFQRPNAGQHAAFGHGPHRCPGANLGRLELRIILEEWLARVPEFAVSKTEPVVVASGSVFGMSRLPLVWDPRRVALFL